MPTYDYVCRNCAHRWELFQSIKAQPLRKCPECGRLMAKRIIGSGAGILFKGSGFYQTDYRSKAYRDAAAADTKSHTAASSESGSTSDSAGKESSASKSTSENDSKSSSD